MGEKLKYFDWTELPILTRIKCILFLGGCVPLLICSNATAIGMFRGVTD